MEKPPPSDLGTLLGTYNGDSDQESVEPDDLEPNYDTGMEALEAGEANEPHLLEPETCRDTADEVTSDNDAASDGAADGGLDSDNDIEIVEIFDHDIDPDNLVASQTSCSVQGEHSSVHYRGKAVVATNPRL